jgi:hypothetical protein
MNARRTTRRTPVATALVASALGLLAVGGAAACSDEDDVIHDPVTAFTTTTDPWATTSSTP